MRFVWGVASCGKVVRPRCGGTRRAGRPERSRRLRRPHPGPDDGPVPHLRAAVRPPFRLSPWRRNRNTLIRNRRFTRKGWPRKAGPALLPGLDGSKAGAGAWVASTGWRHEPGEPKPRGALGWSARRAQVTVEELGEARLRWPLRSARCIPVVDRPQGRGGWRGGAAQGATSYGGGPTGAGCRERGREAPEATWGQRRLEGGSRRPSRPWRGHAANPDAAEPRLLTVAADAAGPVRDQASGSWLGEG